MIYVVLLHISIASLTACGLGLLFGKITTPIALISLTLGFLCTMVAWKKQKTEQSSFFNKAGFSPLALVLLSLVMFFSYFHFVFLFFYSDHAYKTLHINNYGDLSLHLQYIKEFSSAHFWPDNPEFSGEPLRYPFGMDLYNALWEKLFVPTETHLFIVGFIMTFVCAFALMNWMGWLGIGAFFFNGSFINWPNLFTLHQYDWQNQIAWKNFFVSLWITQRGFLFALPVGVLLLNKILIWIFDKHQATRQELVINSILWAALPFFHLHSFFIISLMIFCILLLEGKLKEGLTLFILPIISGSIFVLHSTHLLKGSGLVHFSWNWVANGQNYFLFWLLNLGPWLLIFAIAACPIFMKRFKSYQRLSVLTLSLFFLFTILILAPWDWDNIKILIWPYLLICWLSWRLLLSHWQGKRTWIAAFVLFLSGLISLTHSLPYRGKATTLITQKDLVETQAAVRFTSADSVFLTHTSYNHPLSFLGKKQLMGYEGHLWSHGISFIERKNDIQSIFCGYKGWQDLARKYRLTHIYWGTEEQKLYGHCQPSWQYELENVSASTKIQVFKLSRGD